jgi:hypothetical protein
MAKDVTDRERVWADTQEWLDDIDRNESNVEFDATPTNLGAGEDGHADAVHPPARSTADGADEEVDYGIATDNDRLAHNGAPPVDLDTTEPDPPVDSTDDPSPATPGDLAPAAPGDADVTPTTEPADPDTADENTKTPHPPRYNKKIAAAFAAITAIAALTVSGALLTMRSEPHTADQDHTSRPNTRVSVLAAPTTTSAPAAGGQDSPIPYTATSVGCLPGSTAAQSVAGPDHAQAWVCVTGGNIGQYLVLNLGRSMVITALSLTPGWVGADASGADQWHQHRVLTRVQWSFNDVPPTVVPQDTHNVHGEAPQPMPDHGVLASRIIMLVQETARAPDDATPTTSPAPGNGGLFGEVLGPPVPAAPAPTSSTSTLPGLPADQSHTDPADNTFAVSSIKIFGHPPQ